MYTVVLNANISMYSLYKALELLSVLNKQQCCQVWPVEPNILTDLGRRSGKVV